MAKKELYFWALIPEEPELSQLQKVKESIAREYNSFKSLNSPPHITILPPKHLTATQIEELQEELEQICMHWQPFEIELQGYGRFGQSVLFLNVKLSEHLSGFYEDCKKVYEKHKLTIMHPDFHPHLTLAFKDLEHKQFKRAWDKLKDETYRLRFPVNDLYGLEHDGNKWNVKEVIPLKRT